MPAPFSLPCVWCDRCKAGILCDALMPATLTVSVTFGTIDDAIVIHDCDEYAAEADPLGRRFPPAINTLGTVEVETAVSHESTNDCCQYFGVGGSLSEGFFCSPDAGLWQRAYFSPEPYGGTFLGFGRPGGSDACPIHATLSPCRYEFLVSSVLPGGCGTCVYAQGDLLLSGGTVTCGGGGFVSVTGSGNAAVTSSVSTGLSPPVTIPYSFVIT